MEKLGEGIKKLLLAGVGAAALTAEKSKDILDEMVEKGELTVEQGKALNQELKHNLKKAVKDSVNDTAKADDEEKIENILSKMSTEQIELLKKRLNELEIEDEKEMME